VSTQSKDPDRKPRLVAAAAEVVALRAEVETRLTNLVRWLETETGLSVVELQLTDDVQVELELRHGRASNTQAD
jgi:hypothetical protein